MEYNDAKIIEQMASVSNKIFSQQDLTQINKLRALHLLSDHSNLDNYLTAPSDERYGVVDFYDDMSIKMACTKINDCNVEKAFNFYKNGNIKSLEVFPFLPKKSYHTKFTSYFISGEISKKFSIYYHNYVQVTDGKYQTFFNNGQLREQGYYNLGTKNYKGLTLKYTKCGVLLYAGFKKNIYINIGEEIELNEHKFYNYNNEGLNILTVNSKNRNALKRKYPEGPWLDDKLIPKEVKYYEIF
jgi:hypothetical protein